MESMNPTITIKYPEDTTEELSITDKINIMSMAVAVVRAKTEGGETTNVVHVYRNMLTALRNNE